jgi:polysaccharide deacetylase 2 family uncharacterized protein YibQ
VARRVAKLRRSDTLRRKRIVVLGLALVVAVAFAGTATLWIARAPDKGPHTALSPARDRVAELIESTTLGSKALAPTDATEISGVRPDDRTTLPHSATPAAIGDVSSPQWQRNAVASEAPADRPAIAVVLDDVGVAKANAVLAIGLPPVVTLSFMTYADDVASLAAEARERGHELLLHVPMEPLDRRLDPGPNALRVGMSPMELRRRLEWGLARIEGYVGINNHMGSRFTADQSGMRIVMQTLKERGLIFLDSRTIRDSLGVELAREIDVVHAGRDVFLDNERSATMVAAQLREAERVALQTGAAIAIGHPHPETIEALKTWIPDAQRRGFAIVPVSTIVKRRLAENG